MDLQPSAPYASASSFPSPVQFQIGSDSLLAFEKLHDFCQGGFSPSTNAHAKFQFPGFSSTTKPGFGIDLSSDCPPSSTSPAATWGVAAVHERIRSSGGAYFSPNKIAYRSGGGTDESPPPAPLPSPPTSNSSNLQGILQRYGLGGTTPDQQINKKRLVDLSSSRITQKIRNLDEILRSLDHYSMSKKFTMTATRDVAQPLLSKHRWPEPEMQIGQDMMSDPPTSSSADHSSGNGGASMIPDCITHINKSISRMEFKAQMEKLTGIIEDRWPGSRNSDRIDRGESKEVTNAVCITEMPTERNFKQKPQAKEELPPPPAAPANTTHCSATSSNFLQEMLRNVTGVDRRLAKRDRSKQNKRKLIWERSFRTDGRKSGLRSSSVLEKLEGFFARGRLWVQRPASTKMAAILQKQLRRHAACINQRLDKTDLAIKSLRRQRRAPFPPFLGEDNCQEQGEKKLTWASHSSSDAQAGSLRSSRDMSSTASEKNIAEAGQPTVVEKCMEACETLSRNTQQMKEQLYTLQSDSQQLGHLLEKIQKQSSEQSMEIELCWTAINHLCIDNETFREELQLYQTGLQQQQIGPAHDVHDKLQDFQSGFQQQPLPPSYGQSVREKKNDLGNCEC